MEFGKEMPVYMFVDVNDNFTSLFTVKILVEDQQRNDGSEERPFYMSKRLMQILVIDNVDEPNDLMLEDTKHHYNNY